MTATDTQTTATTKSTTNDPFQAIKEAEGKLKKAVEERAQSNNETLLGAKATKAEELESYEEELRSKGIEKLKETKAKAVEKMQGDLKAVQSEAEVLKKNANSNMAGAVDEIIDAFNELTAK